MYPILVTVGPLQIYSLSVFLVLAWCVFSFVFWRAMREYAHTEEVTFDLMFYGTIFALMGARGAYIATHWDEFASEILKIAALWIAPGLSLLGAIVVGVTAMLFLARRLRVRMGKVFDALAPSLTGALVLGKIGSFLGATEIGVPTKLPLAVHYVGTTSLRHPIQVYEIGALLIILGLIFFVGRIASRDRWAYGMVGIVFFLVYSGVSFGLEFFKESGLYWQGLSANQWILLAVACESIGALYIRGGGRMWTASIFGGLYGWISKRRFG